ncbi:MAG TPA: hypothetical protein VFX79_02515 [Candidatus Saccharimonadales bacterium]|nr:hypothetical protein [Candidatus Saccharimonadales bacterium]
MNETNTNTQAGQDLQNLQPQGNHTQQTSSNFQNGTGVNLSGSNTSSLLNEGGRTGNLSVGIASANSQTSIAPVEPVVLKDSGVPTFYILIPLVLFFFALYLAYRRIIKFDKTTAEDVQAEGVLLEEAARIPKAKKKKRKKPKKAHHH